jgi:hypothetical protein
MIALKVSTHSSFMAGASSPVGKSQLCQYSLRLFLPIFLFRSIRVICDAAGDGRIEPLSFNKKDYVTSVSKASGISGQAVLTWIE